MKLDPIDGGVKWQQDRRLDKQEFVMEDAIYRYLEEIYEMRGFDSTQSKIFARDNTVLIEKLALENKLSYPSEETIIDAGSDLCIFAEGDILKLNYDVKSVRSEVLKEISSRQGAWSDEKGKWIKDPNQELSTLYKADFSKCKIKGMK